jgi:hypothetical protein
MEAAALGARGPPRRRSSLGEEIRLESEKLLAFGALALLSLSE